MPGRIGWAKDRFAMKPLVAVEERQPLTVGAEPQATLAILRQGHDLLAGKKDLEGLRVAIQAQQPAAEGANPTCLATSTFGIRAFSCKIFRISRLIESIILLILKYTE